MQDSAPKPSAGPAPKQTAGEGIKDTIESILIAFVLAFVFRAFIVEAFVIPSGSMATTLMGAHMRFRCPDCGWQWEVNYSPPPAGAEAPADRTGPVRPEGAPRAMDTILPVHCPNCFHKIPPVVVADPDQQAKNTPVRYGDRILVLKYLYLFEPPGRWDVVVFKSPNPPNREIAKEYERHLNDPQANPLPAAMFQENYIKRLVGLPGEEIMILDGDIYVCPAADSAADTRPVDARPWQVQHKPRIVQDALWRVVYNNDFHPLRKEWVQPWKQRPGTGGWKTGDQTSPLTGRIFAFDNTTGAGTLDFDKDADQVAGQGAGKESYWLTDWLAYSETRTSDAGALIGDQYDHAPYSEYIPRWYVSDLKVQFEYNRQSGDGPLRVWLTKLDDSFTAEFSGNQVQLLQAIKDTPAPTPVASANLPAGPLKIEFTNVDYQVTVRVNGHDLIRHGYAPNLADLIARHRHRAGTADPQESRNAFPAPKIGISAERQQCQLSHVSLWRDVYYTPGYDYNYNRGGDRQWGSPEKPVILARRDRPAPGAQGQPEDEYFVLGDNSILSGDARAWTLPVRLPDENLYADSGRVPGRFMLGKAFFVYWPAGFRPFGTSDVPAIVPNFGDMRFIH